VLQLSNLDLVQSLVMQDHERSHIHAPCAPTCADGEPPSPAARVCRSCGLGLLLETREDAAPQRRDAFLIVDSSLCLHGMSEHAEQLLGVREDVAVNRPLSELIVSADAEAGGRGGIAAAIASAIASGEQPRHVFVRPSNTFGVRVRARIVACGPPRAALIVLEGPRATTLRVV